MSEKFDPKVNAPDVESNDGDGRRYTKKEALSSVRSTGHAHLEYPETSERVVELNIGEMADTSPMTPEYYVHAFREVYGDGHMKNLIITAESTFGPGKEHENPKLLKGIKKIMGEKEPEVVHSEVVVEKEDDSEGDPLKGTKYEGVSDSELAYNDPFKSKDGVWLKPGQPGYRQAFKDYLDEKNSS